MILTAIKRENAIWEYKVEGVAVEQGVVPPCGCDVAVGAALWNYVAPSLRIEQQRTSSLGESSFNLVLKKSSGVGKGGAHIPRPI